MRKKILIAVMALMTMATCDIWAQTPYVVYDAETQTLHFLCYDDATLSEITIDDKKITLKDADDDRNCWRGDDATPYGGNPGWRSSKKADVKKVVTHKDFEKVELTSCYNWFNGFINMTEIDLSYINTSNVKNMGSMFNGCTGLTSLNLSSFDTSGVKYMDSMFDGCTGLTSLNLSSFDTSNVTNMNCMFQGCTGLTSLDLSSFHTPNVTSMTQMFSYCTNLTMIDFRNLNTSSLEKKENIEGIFNNANRLALLDLSNAKLNNNASDVIMDNIKILKYLPSGTTEDVNVVVDNACNEFAFFCSDDRPIIVTSGFKANKITVQRDFATDGKPYTVYFPFAISSTDTEKYGKFYKYSGYDPNKSTVTFTEVTETEANKPYLFIPKVSSITIEGTTTVKPTTGVEPAESDVFIGVYETKTFTDAEAQEGIYYGWSSDGTFVKVGEGATVYPCRAYLRLPANSTQSSAPARMSVQFGGETTGISSPANVSSADNAPAYNLNGQRVSAGYRGIVVKNGKKTVVRQ